MVWRFEHRSQPLLSRRLFLGRVARYAAVSLGIVAVSLAIGVAGYRSLAGLSWIDALLNAAMILTGMGPVDRLETPAAKLFASGYALFSGVAFLGVTTLLLAPVVHRLLHALHVELDGEDSERGRARRT